ncbi:MAG: 3-oxoacyl-[acyl-carrier-protein] reductase [Candidatus Omnitrophota bacterium]|nr:3-oxoacyl-[acyl-carrier-protein] reductase [Candidatus Omnitrophota bacterium]
MLLDGKVALITGGGRGIGREIACKFAKAGAEIVICDLNIEDINKTAAKIESFGKKSLGITCDVSVLSEVEHMAKKALDKFGKIDILINNAGVTRDNLLLRMSESDWDKVIAVNLKGAFNCSKAISRLMIKQKSGKIINIASIIGIIGNAGQANYAASKAGVIGLTKSIARELGRRGINVNAIAPGFIETEMTAKLSGDARERMLAQIPLARFGNTCDVANLALFLVSEDSVYLTGQVIQVDGGMVM